MPQYQGIWTLPQQSQALTNQQWVTDPYYKNTVLHLQADGTGNGSQNHTFLDSSTNNFFITRGGNSTQGSFSPFCKPDGQWSNYFDDDAVSITSVTAAGTGDFTYEAWIYPTAFDSLLNLWDHRSGSGHTSGMYFGVNATGNIRIYDVTGSTNAVLLNQWNHIAFVRSSGVLTYYINGISGGSQAFTRNSTDTAFYIGNGNDGPTGTAGFVGYISNMRYTTSAVYTSNFITSTSPLTLLTNTKVIGCQTNRFSYIDSAGVVQNFTLNGTPSVQAFGPFAPARQWTPVVVGGSYYGDGTTDGIYFQDTTQSGTSSDFNLGASNNASVDHWWYPTAAQATAGFSKQVAVPTDWNGQIWYQVNLYDSGNISFFYRSGANYAYISSALPANYLNQWNHVAIASDTSNNLSIFFNGVRIATTVATIGLTTAVNYITFGQQAAGQTASSLKGYMSGLRFIQGSGAFNAASSTITIPTAPPTATATTKLLLNCTNAGIYDATMNNNLETLGNAQVTSIPSKSGNGSIKISDSGDYMKVPFNPSFNFGSGDFTLEAWVYIINKPGTYSHFALHGDSATAAGSSWSFGLENNTFVASFYSGSTGTGVNSTVTTWNYGSWVHVAVTRANNVIRLFTNGSLVKSSTYTSTLNSLSTPLYVGSGAGGDSRVNGYIDDLRITNGVARYIADFTPPKQALPRQ